jgi:hypothetical protein
MNGFDAGRRTLLAGAAAVALSGCTRLDKGAAARTIVLRLPPVSRHVFWERVQIYATQNRLTSGLVPQRAETARNFTFLLRGRGLDIVGRNNAYDLVQPDDYVVGFYAAPIFGAGRIMIDRFADTFRDTLLSENGIHLISDSGAMTSK